MQFKKMQFKDSQDAIQEEVSQLGIAALHRHSAFHIRVLHSGDEWRPPLVLPVSQDAIQQGVSQLGGEVYRHSVFHIGDYTLERWMRSAVYCIGTRFAYKKGASLF